MVHKFQNARQARMDHTTVKSSSIFAPNTWLVSLCLHTHASPQTCHHPASSILAVQISCGIITVFLFRKPLFTIIMAPEHKSSDVGSASKPKRSHDVLSIGVKVKILDMIEIEKKIVCKDCQVVWQDTNPPILKWWKTKKEFHCSIVS